MKLWCKHCKSIIVRDAREKAFKLFMTKRGYKSYCEKIGKDIYLKPKQ